MIKDFYLFFRITVVMQLVTTTTWHNTAVTTLLLVIPPTSVLLAAVEVQVTPPTTLEEDYQVKTQCFCRQSKIEAWVSLLMLIQLHVKKNTKCIQRNQNFSWSMNMCYPYLIQDKLVSSFSVTFLTWRFENGTKLWKTNIENNDVVMVQRK